MAEAGVVVIRKFEAPRRLVWALLADTNRYNRALGLGIPQYSWRERDGRNELVAKVTQRGVELAWVEPPYEWIEGTFLSSHKQFIEGPVASGGLTIEVEGDASGCTARVHAFGKTRGLLLWLLGPLLRANLRRQIRAYLAAIASIVEDPKHRERLEGVSQPAVLAAADLLDGPTDPLTSGETTPPRSAAELQRRVDALRRAVGTSQVVERLVDQLLHRPDEEVAQMRPFELARLWGHDRRAVLSVFLHATRTGLVDLNWQVNCPVCKVASEVAPRMRDVDRTAHCSACNIRFDADFASNVEAVFRCNKAIRAVESKIYCAASPAWRPHVLAQLEVPARAKRRIPLELDDGRVHVRTLEGQDACDLLDGDAPEQIEIVVDDNEISAQASGESAGRTRVELHNRTDRTVHILLERGAWSADVVLGSVIASLPEFVDLFATEAPAAGHELSISRLTLLFSDLTGSTALYERIGDARAFAIVQEHFGLMEATALAHGGAVIKTMGDAVMASFPTPGDAVAAAIEMVASTDERHAAIGVGVKLGIHEGPALAVRANDRLDFFGTTVNVCARLQAQAGAGELVMLRSVADQEPVARLVVGYARRESAAALKGISKKQTLVGFDLRSPSPQPPLGPRKGGRPVGAVDSSRSERDGRPPV